MRSESILTRRNYPTRPTTTRCSDDGSGGGARIARRRSHFALPLPDVHVVSVRGLPDPLQLGDAHSGEALFPGVEGLLADPQLATELHRRRALLDLPDRVGDLLLATSISASLSSFQEGLKQAKSSTSFSSSFWGSGHPCTDERDRVLPLTRAYHTSWGSSRIPISLRRSRRSAVRGSSPFPMKCQCVAGVNPYHAKQEVCSRKRLPPTMTVCS
jgi:hypothetical protein